MGKKSNQMNLSNNPTINLRTPIQTLEKEIEFFNFFIDKIDKKDGFDPGVSEKYLETMKHFATIRIKDFEKAITILKEKV